MGLGVDKLKVLRDKLTSVQGDTMPKPKTWTGSGMTEKCKVCLRTSVSKLCSLPHQHRLVQRTDKPLSLGTELRLSQHSTGRPPLDPCEDPTMGILGVVQQASGAASSSQGLALLLQIHHTSHGTHRCSSLLLPFACHILSLIPPNPTRSALSSLFDR